MDKLFHPTLYLRGDCFSMLGLKFIRVSERGPVRYDWRTVSRNYSLRDTGGSIIQLYENYLYVNKITHIKGL